MSTVEERKAYLNNPFFTKHIYGDFSPFYATIAVCTVLCVFLIALNIICGCCSKHKSYWQDRHTGNRWLISIWSVTPHKQPPLDLTELKDASYFEQFKPVFQDVEKGTLQEPTHHQAQEQLQYQPAPQRQQRERPVRPQRPSRSQTPQQYSELQKIESDI